MKHFLNNNLKRRLSISALETLSIIAYKQPVTKSDIEKIRGVNCDYTIQKLLDKGLIVIKGKSDKVGRPLIYITSDKFMDYFGINNLDQLPTIKDFQKEEIQLVMRRSLSQLKSELINLYLNQVYVQEEKPISL